MIYKFLCLILCQWLKRHWLRDHSTTYDDKMVTYWPERYCCLCGYWPALDEYKEE
jgi:hypothetical protein